MTWTALVPLKGTSERKSRLASWLSPGERWQLTETMFRHVTSVLRTVPEIARIIVISDRCPEGWQEEWKIDLGRGLNQELEAVRAAIKDSKLVILNADLPFLRMTEVNDLLAGTLTGAGGGCAIAPDRHDTGTNALALGSGSSFRLSFGVDSFNRHREQGGSTMAVIKQFGLAFDVDTLEDYKLAIAYGMSPAAPG